MKRILSYRLIGLPVVFNDQAFVPVRAMPLNVFIGPYLTHVHRFLVRICSDAGWKPETFSDLGSLFDACKAAPGPFLVLMDFDPDLGAVHRLIEMYRGRVCIVALTESPVAYATLTPGLRAQERSSFAGAILLPVVEVELIRLLNDAAKQLER